VSPWGEVAEPWLLANAWTAGMSATSVGGAAATATAGTTGGAADTALLRGSLAVHVPWDRVAPAVVGADPWRTWWWWWCGGRARGQLLGVVGEFSKLEPRAAIGERRQWLDVLENFRLEGELAAHVAEEG
jgi:hypothetical protein